MAGIYAELNQEVIDAIKYQHEPSKIPLDQATENAIDFLERHKDFISNPFQPKYNDQ